MGWRDYIGALREQEQIIQVQQATIEQLEQHLKQQQGRLEQLEAELRAKKKLKGKPKLSASQRWRSAQGEAGRRETSRFSQAQ